MGNNERGVFSRLVTMWISATSLTKLTSFILVVLAVGTSLQVVYTDSVRRNLLQCQVQFMEQTASSLEARSSASNASGDALESLISGLKESTDSDETQRLYEDYLEVRTQQRKLQEANPYPQIKIDEFCYEH